MGDHLGWHGRGYIPHWDTPDVPQHIVFRRLGSVPRHLRPATMMSGPAHGGPEGGPVLSCPAVAPIVENALLYFDAIRYDVLAWCIMPCHVHVAAVWRQGFSTGATIRSWKAYTARQVNAALGRAGPLWTRDYFDRAVRNERQLSDLVEYVESNPVRAGLAATAAEWPCSSARRRPVCEPEGSRSEARP